jgi:hypothetical protein
VFLLVVVVVLSSEGVPRCASSLAAFILSLWDVAVDGTGVGENKGEKGGE